MPSKTGIQLGTLIMVAFFGLSPFSLHQQLNAQTSSSSGSLEANTRNWAWNDNVGWFSHNSVDDPSLSFTYGVNINETTGALSGNAWNEIFQWIDFAPAGPWPNDPAPLQNTAYAAKYDPSTRKLSGYAKIVAFGDQGWIKLRDEGSCGGCPYGVSVGSDGHLSGFAWSDRIGFIDFAPRYGGVTHNKKANPSLSGFAWNEGYGWISFRYTDYDVAYGVNLQKDLRLIGYAWNENVGWLQYDPAGPYPGSPNQSATWNLRTGEISGWAKIIGLGAQGWVSMQNAPGERVRYAAKIIFDPGKSNHGNWTGYAWNDLIGWIQFDHQFTSKIVHTDFDIGGPNTPILITPVSTTDPPNCVNTITIKPSAPLEPNLVWSDYSALDNSTQQTYHVQVDDNSDFSSPVIDYSAPVPPGSKASNHLVDPGLLEYNKTYYWRVRVLSSTGQYSEFGVTGVAGEKNCFNTPKHQPPVVNFIPQAQCPLSSPATFTDKTQVFGGATIAKWSWDFGDGTVLTGSDPNVHQNPTHAYSTAGTKTITLTVTDSDGLTGSKTLSCEVKKSEFKLPKFRRIIPR